MVLETVFSLLSDFVETSGKICALHPCPPTCACPGRAKLCRLPRLQLLRRGLALGSPKFFLGFLVQSLCVESLRK